MGLRFRRSSKISKGIKINFTKTGASLSLGGRGNSLNFGSRGVMHTVGIPGTGISYRTNLNKTSAKKNTSSKKTASASLGSRSSNRSSNNAQTEICIVMDSNGRVVIQRANGDPIADETLLRKIKATDAYKETKQNLEIQRQNMLSQYYSESVQENDKLINIHKMSPKVDSIDYYLDILNTMVPSVYQIPPFMEPMPSVDTVSAELKYEARTNVKGNIFKIGKLRRQYVDDNLQARFDAAITEWEKKEREYYQEQKQTETNENLRFLRIHEEDKAYLEALIRGDSDVVCGAIDNWLTTCELPLEFNVDYEWLPEHNILFLDVDLPEIEDLPDMELIRLESGNLKEKKKTQATLKREYVTMTLGLSVFISANLFNVSPAIHSIAISGYTQRRDRLGEIKDEYVYSINYIRDVFQNTVLADVVPEEFCKLFENRMNITSSMTMKTITPYEITD